jgi:hypothetical protein
MPKYEVKLNEQYKDKNTANSYIEIQEEPYTGLSFVFGPIEFSGENSDGTGVINFDYHLLFVPENIMLEEHKKDIESMIARILQNILEKEVLEKGNESDATI